MGNEGNGRRGEVVRERGSRLGFVDGRTGLAGRVLVGGQTAAVATACPPSGGGGRSLFPAPRRGRVLSAAGVFERAGYPAHIGTRTGWVPGGWMTILRRVWVRAVGSCLTHPAGRVRGLSESRFRGMPEGG
jgi:hypothetical protein